MSFRAIRFPLVDLHEQVEAFAFRWPAAAADEAGLQFVSDDRQARLRLPLAGPRARAGQWVSEYLEGLESWRNDERQVVLLLQAGAMAVGYWHGDELLHHKAVRKYVIRGNGKSQVTHLKTRGKSRYGSRLRLQNWRRLLTETNERLRADQELSGAAARVFYAAPVRIWPELFAAEPPPPFARDADELQRIPMHVHRPDHQELLRVRSWLIRGRVELPAS